MTDERYQRQHDVADIADDQHRKWYRDDDDWAKMYDAFGLPDIQKIGCSGCGLVLDGIGPEPLATMKQHIIENPDHATPNEATMRVIAIKLSEFADRLMADDYTCTHDGLTFDKGEDYAEHHLAEHPDCNPEGMRAALEQRRKLDAERKATDASFAPIKAEPPTNPSFNPRDN